MSRAQNGVESLTLRDLDSMVLPSEHSLSVTDLRRHAYRKAAGKPGLVEVEKHLLGCESCQTTLALLEKTDPVLRGEDQKIVER